MFLQMLTIMFHIFLKAYWADSKDVSDMALLQEIGAQYAVDALQVIKSPESSQTLRSYTQEAAERGAFGVPR